MRRTSYFPDSKTEAVVFPPPGMESSMFNTSPVSVLDEYATYKNRFKYLGSYITSKLSDTYDVKNRVIQANKANGINDAKCFSE
eukprot:12774109-Ditylum_brightwellii.AAC.1